MDNSSAASYPKMRLSPLMLGFCVLDLGRFPAHIMALQTKEVTFCLAGIGWMLSGGNGTPSEVVGGNLFP